jgi:cbb3-type cytochrome oxidase subunit 3
MSIASAWIAARFRRAGGAVIAGVVIVSAIFMAVVGMRKAAYRKGKKEERAEADIERLERAVKEGNDHAEIADAMHRANVNGPRTRDDVLERLRNDED